MMEPSAIDLRSGGTEIPFETVETIVD